MATSNLRAYQSGIDNLALMTLVIGTLFLPETKDRPVDRRVPQ